MEIAIRFAASPPPPAIAGGGAGDGRRGGGAVRVAVLGGGRRLEAAAAAAAAVGNSARCRAKKGGGTGGALGGIGVEEGGGDQLSVVMKFGGSSVSSAARMREVTGLIAAFPEERPVVVLSAMGKTTNLLLLAGEKAVGCGVIRVSEIEEWNLLKGIAMMKELTLRTTDYLVSFGECMSTRIFAAYLNKVGVKARQCDAFDIGFITTDDFGNADILEATYPAVAKRIHGDWIRDPAIPIVTGFLGKGWKSGAVTTLGRGGSDLTATTIGKALGLREIQVWKDVDGVLTCDPNIYPNATTVPYLTFEEAAELAYFGAQVLHPQSMRPAREGDIPVRVKNSYNPKAPGTLITKHRDMDKVVLTSIVLKSNVTMLDIVSTRMLGQFGFLAKELDHVVEELEKIAVVHLLQQRAIISLIGNVRRSSLILEKEKRSECPDDLASEAKQCIKALHQAFFEDDVLTEVDEDALHMS
uniref:Aspartokinase n=1 Tax=Leersia perrieri TaxID=77586 RepID=A0A0D9V9T8_9ORYZ